MKTTNTPRTIAQLAPWLEQQFDNLAKAIDQSQTSSSVFESNGQPRLTVQELLNYFLQIVGQLRQTFVSHIDEANDPITTEQIARALVISGSGTGFDPAIRSEIRRYSEAAEEIVRWELMEKISEKTRNEAITGWKRTLGNHRNNLEMLGVVIEEIEVGTEYQPGNHQLEREVPTHVSQSRNTVARAVTPLFAWRDTSGQASSQPARVWVYTKAADQSASTQTHGPIPMPSGNGAGRHCSQRNRHHG